jgi:hypothetical protein
MSTPALRAHYHLITLLKARTVPAREPVCIKGGRSAAATHSMNARIWDLIDQGLRDFEIAIELWTSKSTVSRHRRRGRIL